MPYYNNQNYGTPNSLNQAANFQPGGTTSYGNYGQLNGIISMVVNVNGEDGARNYPVAAGNTVFLIDFNTNQFWIKSTSQNGLSEQFRSFSFEEKTPKAEPISSDYVTKQELNDLKAYLDTQFNGIRNQLFSQKRGQVNDKSNVK